MASGTTLFEHSYYIGGYMGGILYGKCLLNTWAVACADRYMAPGFEVTVYFMILQALFRKGNKNSASSRRFCATYSTFMILFATIDVACNAIWGEQMWITYRNIPGGVAEYIATRVSVWYETLGSTSVVCSVFLGDGLLVNGPYFLRVWLLISSVRYTAPIWFMEDMFPS